MYPGGGDEGLLRVEGRTGDGEWQPLVMECGMLVRDAEGSVLQPVAAHALTQVNSIRRAVDGRALVLDYEENVAGAVLARRLQVRLVGGSLEMRMEAPAAPASGYPAYCGVSLGPLGPPGARVVSIGGLPDPLHVLPSGAFLSGYPDRLLGAASSYTSAGSLYRPAAGSTARVIRDTYYVTISRDPLEPLPALRRAPAAYRATLATRFVVDLFSRARYADDERAVRMLARYGLEDVVLIYRNWQLHPYREREPHFYPANPERGTAEEFRSLLRAADQAGWIVALREEFASLAHGSPYWNDAAAAHWWDGTLRLNNSGTPALGSEHMEAVARLEATQIVRNYAPTAVFVGVHTAWNPEGALRQVDDSEGTTGEADAIVRTAELLEYLRETHAGPVLGAAGEGVHRFDTLCAGAADGVVRGVEGGLRGPLVVDYDLEEVHPLMVGIGAGSYRQFAGQRGREAVDPERLNLEAYRATTLALGHAGYIGTYEVRQPHGEEGVPPGFGGAAAREYYLTRAVQELYLESRVQEVHYAEGEAWYRLAEALRQGLDLANARVRVRYERGLEVWVNRAREGDWEVDSAEGRFVLPPNGFLVLSAVPRLLAYSALLEGERTAFCRCARYTFLEARGGQLRRIGEFQTDGGAALLRSEVSGRPDVLLLGAQALVVGDEEYHLSERGDARLTHRSGREVEVTVLETASGRPANFSWPAFSAGWRGNRFEVAAWERGGWRASRAQVVPTRTGPSLQRAQVGITYRVRLAATAGLHSPVRAMRSVHA